MANQSRKTSFIFIHFLAEDKFSYCTFPSSHSLKVCYIQVWNNKQYHSWLGTITNINFCSKQTLAITAVVWVKYRNYMLVLPIIDSFQTFKNFIKTLLSFHINFNIFWKTIWPSQTYGAFFNVTGPSLHNIDINIKILQPNPNINKKWSVVISSVLLNKGNNFR